MQTQANFKSTYLHAQQPALTQTVSNASGNGKPKTKVPGAENLSDEAATVAVDVLAAVRTRQRWVRKHKDKSLTFTAVAIKSVSPESADLHRESHKPAR
jgi:hypothetical protein